MSLIEHVTVEECRNRIARLEVGVDKTADELREMRKTWNMTVCQRNALDTIEHYEFLLGSEG